MCEQYHSLLGANRQQILQSLYPHDFEATDCPAAADSLDDYLNTGDVPQIDQDYRPERYDISARWRRVNINQLKGVVRNLGDCHHVVVRAQRPRQVQRRLGLTPTHFFVVANIRGDVYVVDAMTQEVTSDIAAYVRRNGFNHLEYTLNYSARPAVEF